MTDLAGEWWLPERSERRERGTLTIDDDGRARLLLIGELRSPWDEGERTVNDDGSTLVTMTEKSLNAAGVYPRIVGQVGASYLTLEDCFRSNHNRNLMGGLPSESIHVNQVFKGIGFDAGEALEFDGISVALKWLSHWMQETGIEESHELEKREDGLSLRKVVLTGRRLPPRKLEMPFGTLTLGHNYGFSGDRLTERAIQQGHYFSIEVPSLAPALDLVDIISDLQDLVSIGTNLTAEFEEVNMLHPDVVHELPSGPVREQVAWYAQWNARDRSNKTTITDYDMIFTFKELGEMDGLRRWLTVAGKHREALGRVMATRYSPHMYLSDRLLNRAAALERLDREETRHTGSSFRTRMRRCADLAGPPFEEIVGDVDRWIDTFRDDRDDVAHHFGRRPRRQSGGQLHLADTAYWLFVLCMMRLADAPAAAFDRLSGHQQIRWNRDGLASAMGTAPGT